MVSIRLARRGAKKAPVYRIVAADSRNRRDGRFLEILGTYTPSGANKGITVQNERVEYWLSKGAKPSDTVQRLIKQVGKTEAVAG